MQFENFYMSKHNGRMLSWLHHLSLAELRMTYLRKMYTIGVSTYQMAVLLAFNQAVVHTGESLSSLTQLPQQELASTVQSLLDSKVLEAVAEGGEAMADGGRDKKVNRDSQIKLNMNYTNKRTKFKVTAILQKDSHQV